MLLQKRYLYTGNLNLETSGDSKNAFLNCGDVLALFNPETSNPIQKRHPYPAYPNSETHLEVCVHDSQLVVCGICPLISSSHLGSHAGCICLVLPLHCQQCVLPVLGLIQPPVQIQDAVLQLLHTGGSLSSQAGLSV